MLDTSVFIAGEQGRPLGDPPPGMAHLSVATLTELEAGALRATTDEARQVRRATLERARRFIVLPYDERVSAVLAAVLAGARDRQRRAAMADAIIAATAVAHDLAVWTQDDDFAVLAELEPRLRVHRG